MSSLIRGCGADLCRRGAWIATALVALALLVVPLLLGGGAMKVDPVHRLRPPGAVHWFGTDQLGRDLLLRCVEGGQVSLAIGVSVAVLALATGTALGLLALRSRALDLLLMRLADGL